MMSLVLSMQSRLLLPMNLSGVLTGSKKTLICGFSGDSSNQMPREVSSPCKTISYEQQQAIVTAWCPGPVVVVHNYLVVKQGPTICSDICCNWSADDVSL